MHILPPLAADRNDPYWIAVLCSVCKDRVESFVRAVKDEEKTGVKNALV